MADQSTLPHAPATERNRLAILSALRQLLPERAAVLEIGSGTGQHAVFFAGCVPGWTWQASDRAQNLPGINGWIHHADMPNTPPAIALNVRDTWPTTQYDAIFSANTLHIMSWPEVELLFAQVARVLKPGALLLIYGPFNIGGHYTSPSNESFDASLRASAAHQGIRDLEAVHELASAAGLTAIANLEMPANNRLLGWRYGH